MLEQRIIDTLRFFALQGIGLTLFELHKYLITDVEVLRQYVDTKFELTAIVPAQSSVPIDEVADAIQNLKDQGIVVEQYGYYALSQNKELPIERWKAHRFGAPRERLIRRYTKVLGYIPFIRGVGLAGSQALGLEKQGSDIDLLIITEPNFLWIARTAVTFVLQVLGIRRYRSYISNRFCLNHYIAGARLLEEKNLYTALEYAKLRPLVYASEVNRFQEQNKVWIGGFFPNLQLQNSKTNSQSLLQRSLEVIFNNPLGRILERKLGDLQRRRIHLEEFVVVRDDELSFHPSSKQEKILQEFFATH